MELEQCNNNLLSSNKIAKSKKNTVNTDTKDLNKKSFEIVLHEEVQGKKFSISKESNIQSYMTKRELTPEDPVTAAVSKLANGFGVSKDFMLAILKSLNISPQDLLDPTKEALIRQKLEYYFGISEKKKKLLDELMRVIPHK